MNGIHTYTGWEPQVGDDVRHYFLNRGGWRFGRIIGLHTDSIGIDATGLEMATVRFLAYREFPIEDHSLACFLLEKCSG